jgi:hypothetical protein
MRLQHDGDRRREDADGGEAERDAADGATRGKGSF